MSSDKAGQRIDCPSCQGSLLVPSATAAQGLFDDIFDAGVSPALQPPVASTPAPEPDSDDSRGVGSEVDSDEDMLAGIQVPGASSADDINPLIGEDPFEVDEGGTLKVDGIGDLFEHSDVYGFRCNICDTRIHVRPDQIDSFVECPECYSKLKVPAPPKDPKPAQRWVKEGRDKRSKSGDDDELKLSEPVNRPPVEIDESYGLEAPAENLLTPKPKSLAPGDEEGEGGLEIIEDDSVHPTSARNLRSTPRPTKQKRSERMPDSEDASEAKSPETRSPTRNMSRRQRYEDSQRRQQAEEAGTAYRPTDSLESSDFPEFDLSSLLSSSLAMIKSPGVIWRTLIAIGLMCFGLIAMQWIAPDSAPALEAEEQVAFFDWLKVAVAWALFGGVPYLLGIAVLWFTSAYIYRDAALGHREVETWKNAGSSEVIGTFLIFGFGFFIGGLPALFLTLMTLPLRVLFGPLLLLGSWYSQAPFSIVNVDAYRNVNQNMGQWIAFYKFMFLLAGLGFVAGMIFWARAVIPGSAFVLTAIASVVGVLLVTAITLVFAAVCGWHCGKVVEGLSESA